MADVPDFSGVAESYSRARPSYPGDLFRWLAALVERRDLAWDTATGSGQAAVGLAERFQRVVATDLSEEQIRHARRHPRVEYRVGRAEESGLAAGSVDLVAAAAALHWFDLPRFHREARRVTRGGGVVAAWTYHVAHVEPPFDALLWPFYRDVVGPYFAEGAALVDERYRSVTLPGRKIEAPSFVMKASWTAAQMLDFIGTWSGVQACRKSLGRDPLAELAPEVRSLWGPEDAVREVRWPLALLASRL